jgi:poly-beta-1,6-N-acetyl-D-glucosamine synthase
MMNHDKRKQRRYVLATAAYNEEKYIESVIKSVVAQTEPPLSWIIVSDGSTDRTDEIVTHYAGKFKFIQLYRLTEDHARNFVAQVQAINAGFLQLKTIEYDFIGNLDSDVTLEPSYYRAVLERFDCDKTLGLAGGYIWEEERGVFQCRKANSPWSVAHAVQLFRRECLDSIGGAYVPQPFGGPDWHAEVSARMQKWRVQAFPELRVFHHRPTGGAEGVLKSYYRRGLMEYSFGSHPVFELFKVARRITTGWPDVLGPTTMLAAFLWAHLKRRDRSVSEEVIRFLRREQLSRLKTFVSLRRGSGQQPCE